MTPNFADFISPPTLEGKNYGVRGRGGGGFQLSLDSSQKVCRGRGQAWYHIEAVSVAIRIFKRKFEKLPP